MAVIETVLVWGAAVTWHLWVLLFVLSVVLVSVCLLLFWVFKKILGDGLEHRDRIWTDEQRAWFKQHGEFKE
jgi:hypothetical protein